MILDENIEIIQTNLEFVKGESGFIKDGDWIETKDQDPNGEVRLIQLADIGDGEFLNKSNRFLTKEKANELNCTFLNEGDLLVARMPDPIGRACIFPGDSKECITAVDVMIIRSDRNLVNNRWLKYKINSPKFRNKLNKYINGTTRKRISRSNFEKIPLEFPDINVQIKTADLFDKASSLIKKRQETIKLADEFLRSTFLEMFGDPYLNAKGWKKINTIDVCDCIVPGRDKPKSFTGDIPWVTTDDLNHLQYTYTSKKGIGLSNVEISDVNARVIPKSSVLMTCVGDLGIISIAGNKMVVNQQLHTFQCSSEINNIFLMYNLNFQKPYMVKIASSTTVPYLNKTNCNSTPTILPPIGLQDKFAEIVIKTEALKEKYKTSLTEMENQFNSLMQKAFRGEL